MKSVVWFVRLWICRWKLADSPFPKARSVSFHLCQTTTRWRSAHDKSGFSNWSIGKNGNSAFRTYWKNRNLVFFHNCGLTLFFFFNVFSRLISGSRKVLPRNTVRHEGLCYCRWGHCFRSELKLKQWENFTHDCQDFVNWELTTVQIQSSIFIALWLSPYSVLVLYE